MNPDFSCSNCAYYFAKQTQCRKAPPTALTMSGKNKLTGGMEMNTLAIFPPAAPDMWCGGHQLELTVYPAPGNNCEQCHGDGYYKAGIPCDCCKGTGTRPMASPLSPVFDK